MAQKKTIQKAVLIGFLIFIIIGFTAPLIDFTAQEQIENSQPKVCRADPECTITCNGQEQPVLCSQNLCAVNTCDYVNPFALEDKSKTITLHAILNNQTHSFNANPLDLFVKGQNSKIEVFSSSLPLQIIAEKVGLIVTDQCMALNNQVYCTDENHNLTIKVNNETSYASYIPSQGDEIVVVYS